MIDAFVGLMILSLVLVVACLLLYTRLQDEKDLTKWQQEQINSMETIRMSHIKEMQGE